MISLIVPVYNARPYLSDLVGNLQRQTFAEFEVLFVDDCSTDGSREELRRIEKVDSRFRMFEHSTNRGPGASRNTGLANARGEFVMYVDDDDSFGTDYLRTMHDFIVRDGSDVVICNSIWEYPERRDLHNTFIDRPKTKHLLLNGRDALRRYFHIYSADLWIPVEPWGKIVRRTLLSKNDLWFKEALFEDVVMTFCELTFSNTVTFISDPLYVYNKKSANAATVASRGQCIREMYRAPEGIVEIVNQRGMERELGEFTHLFFFRFLNGTYSFFAKGLQLRDEMKYALGRYRTVITQPDVGDHAAEVLQHLRGFYCEMKEHGMLDLYTEFLLPFRSWLDFVVMEQLLRPKPGVRREVVEALSVLGGAAKVIGGRIWKHIGLRS